MKEQLAAAAHFRDCFYNAQRAGKNKSIYDADMGAYFPEGNNANKNQELIQPDPAHTGEIFFDICLLSSRNIHAFA